MGRHRLQWLGGITFQLSICYRRSYDSSFLHWQALTYCAIIYDISIRILRIQNCYNTAASFVFNWVNWRNLSPETTSRFITNDSLDEHDTLSLLAGLEIKKKNQDTSSRNRLWVVYTHTCVHLLHAHAHAHLVFFCRCSTTVKTRCTNLLLKLFWLHHQPHFGPWCVTLYRLSRQLYFDFLSSS